MKKTFTISACIFLFLANSLSYLSAQKVTVSGYVKDANSGEPLIGANIYEGITLKGVITNTYGFYSLTLPAGQTKLVFSFVGYNTLFLDKLDLNTDTLINVSLGSTIELEGVEIKGSRIESEVESSQMSMSTIPINTIKSLPVLLGEVDIIKTIQLLPGVQSGSEGSSGLYVRGGGPDQNLILLDGVPVYNVNHLFGFFSVFNADALNSISLVKGGFPARYGGRLSSVLDIRMKEGNSKEFRGEGAIGLIASKLTLEGPIKNEKTSFIISGRRTYIDLLNQLILNSEANSDGIDKLRAGYYFYDLNAKINHQFNNRNRLFLSAYLGNDKAYYYEKETYQDDFYENDFLLRWGNITSALRWNYVINNKLFSNTTVTYSRYKFLTGIEYASKDSHFEERFDFEYSSGINDVAFKVDFDYMPNPNHYIRFGVSNIYHAFNPGINAFKLSISDQGSDNIDTTFGNQKIYSNELDLYCEDDVIVNARIKANIGIHYSAFYVKKNYYHSIQPRFSSRFLINQKWSLKTAYSRMAQYIHLLSNSSIGLPTDLWLPVTDKIKPMNSEQFAIGTVYALNNKTSLSLEGFYKTMNNLIEYKEGASFLSTNDDWQDKIEQGKGWAYGIELLIDKKMGKTTGWIGYSLSWSERQFDNISFGERFPYKYDRRHDISIVINHKFNHKLDIGATWVFGTGNAVTLATEKYLPHISNGGYSYGYIEYFEKRNAFRMPSYHRLDIAINMHKVKRWGTRTWSLGVYNLYNRKNPFFLYYDNDFIFGGGSERVLKQVSLFPIIPSISYSFKF